MAEVYAYILKENATEEYLSLFAQKTMQFVRAPDENVFIAPFNLIEIFGLVIPFEWWMPKAQYEKLNDIVMGFIYSPLLCITALLETRTARKVRFNRSRREEDDDTIEEWEQLEGDLDVEGTGWSKRVEESSPNVIQDANMVEFKKLRDEIAELKQMIREMTPQPGSANGGKNGRS